MELKQLCEKTLDIFKIKDMSELSNALFDVCRNNDTEKLRDFADTVQDLSVDWLQKIFQYYEADRKEKMQDYTPKSLADFLGLLVGDDTEIIDMCAGSGALTIQKWNRNHDTAFKLYEYDEKVIPYLIFNMMLRNIQCEIYHMDVLQDEVFHVYRVIRKERFGECKEVA